MKKTVSLFLAVLMVISMIPAAAAAGFADVDEGAWYAEAVDYVVSNKLMNGYSATEFGVGDTLSRAMIAQILFNKEGQPAPSGSHGFPDVPADQWFNNAVTWATQNGVMSGYGEGKFGPNDHVTLEQIAVILWKYAGEPAVSGSADAVGEHSSWAANGLAWAVENGIWANFPYHAATAAATRVQAAQMLTNYLTGAAGGITKLTDHGYILSIPTPFVNLVDVTCWQDYPDNGFTTLFSISRRAPEEFLFDFCRVSGEENLPDFTSVDEVFARDNQGNFFLFSEPGDPPEWAFPGHPDYGTPVVDMTDWVNSAPMTFIEDNGLTPYFKNTRVFDFLLYQLANGSQTTVLKHSNGEQHQALTLPGLKSLPTGIVLPYVSAEDVPTDGPYISLHAPGWFNDYTYDFFIDENAQHVVRITTPATQWAPAQTEYYTATYNDEPYPIGKAILSCWNELTGKAADSTVTGITLDITEHKMGEDWTQYLTATLSPAGAKDTITWTSSNPKVATVNEKGKVSGVAGGETIITATTSNGLTATCKIEVWHSHKLTKTTPATCTGAGAETYTCSFCGHSYDKYLPPLGGSHTWSSGTCSKCKVSAYDYNAVAAVVNTGYKGYDMLLGEYSHAMSLGSTSAIARFSDVCDKQGGGKHFSEYFVGEQLEYDGKLTYALYDIDANGIPELLVGDSYHDDFLLYALNAAGNVVYINESAYNYPLCILTNGRILLEGHLGLFSGNYTLLRLGANGKTTTLETYGFDSYDSGPNMISEDAWYARVEKLKKDSVMSKLKWNALP